ncbi:MAG: phenylalanine--tRNA ligase subunit beta [Candidatus Binatia bacterium]
MRLSYQWLGELVEGLPDVEEVARRLTMGGIEVEAVLRPERSYGDRLVVARIEEMGQHPNADRLTVCHVDDGAGDGLRTIVCGARNHRTGDTVVLARIGCELPGGLVIKKSKLRGVDSEGMLCSAAELGLAPGEEGIVILEPGLEPGTDAAHLLGLDDTILELGITPNRGDCLSMVGLARETAALCGLRLRPAPATIPVPRGESSVSVEIEDTDGCPRYHGLVMSGVRVGPSPTWLRTRLASLGLRSINNVVDVTNFVMMERGQPLHAFDLSKIHASRIVVRRAREGETIRTLDARDVKLFAEDLVIADAAAPVAVAGVMGGEASAVEDNTTDLFLESAMFAPPVVRRTSRRHGVLSDSSYRFERGVDPTGVHEALLRAATLLVEVAGASPRGGMAEAGPGAPRRASVAVRSDRVRTLLGLAVDDSRIESVLTAIGAAPVSNASGFDVTAPGHRQDLGREIDYVEEVARVVGYEAIEPAMPQVQLVPVLVPESVRAAAALRDLLSGVGLHEHVTVSFTSEAANARFPGLFAGGASVLVRNPLRSDATALQRSALGALSAALGANVAMQQPRVDLFTIARTFSASSDGAPDQREVVAGLLYGPRPGPRPGQFRDLVFADVKAVVEKVLGVLSPGTPIEFVAVTGRPEFHPRAAAEVLVAGQSVGLLGRLHPDVSEGSEIAGEIYLFEVDCRLAVTYRRAHPGLQPIPRYPSSERDVSLLTALDMPAGAAIRAVEELGEPCIESISIFDEYTGAGTGSDRKALGYRLVYRAADRTLTDAEVTALHERVVGHLTERLAAQVRV